MAILSKAIGGLSIGVLLSAMMPASAAETPRQAPISLAIPAQLLGDALNAFAQQTGLQIMFYTELGERTTSGAINGTFSPEVALNRLLADTNLAYEFVDERTVAIRAARGSGGGPSNKISAANGEEKDQSMLLAQSESSAAAGEHRSGQPKKEITEIIVTAQKREERLQDVPVPVAVLDAAGLVDQNQLRLEDYYSQVPGLNLIALGSTGNSVISIRGLTTGGFTNPTAGIVIDDIPFGSSTMGGSYGAGILAYDLDPSELSRIEVLRGPQGTLYGASSIGGLLKYVTARPSTDAATGRLQIGTSAVNGSGDFGYSVRGAANLPLSENFAIRISASSRLDPGYIDNLRTGEEDVNRITSQSGRLAARWRPGDNFTLDLSALYQHTEREGNSDVHLPSPAGPQTGLVSGRPDLDGLEQSAFPGTGRYEREYAAYSATMTLDLGAAELTSLSGYNVGNIIEALDRSPQFGARSQNFFLVPGYISEADVEISKLSQELRLTVPITERLEWLVGGFYTRERYPAVIRTFARSEMTGADVATWNTSTNDGRFVERAAFTNLTIDFTKRFDMQIGGRVSRNSLSNGPLINEGPLVSLIFGIPAGRLVTPQFRSTDDAFTYSIAPRFKITPDLMVYGRVASGYRPGGPNTSVALQGANLPIQYGPDTTTNYEVGMKGDAFGGRLSFDASVYYIDWQDVQIQLQGAGTGSTTLFYTFNAGGARSQGVELSFDMRPTEGLKISSWVAYNDAVFTSVPTNSVLTARKGDRLPYGAKRSGNVSIEQAFPLSPDVSAFVGASASYVGERRGSFFTGFPQGTFPAYTQVNLRAGIQFDNWSLNGFVNNLTDARGVLRSGRDADVPYAITYTQPRTVGLAVSRGF